MKKIIFIFFCISLISIVTAEWYNPLTWFGNDEVTQLQNRLGQIQTKTTGEYSWVTYTDKNDEYDVIIEDKNKQKTRIKFCHKTITDKKDLPNKMDLCFDKDCQENIKLNQKQDGDKICYERNVDTEYFLKFNPTTIYQETNVINYDTEWANVNVSLVCDGVAQNDIWVRDTEGKFGANGTFDGLKNCTYLVESSNNLYQNGISPYIRNPTPRCDGGIPEYCDYETHEINFNDVCSRVFEVDGINVSANCEFDYLDNTTLEVTFISDNNIDPTVELSNADVYTTSSLDNVSVEANYSHLEIADNDIYNNMWLYLSMDADPTNDDFGYFDKVDSEKVQMADSSDTDSVNFTIGMWTTKKHAENYVRLATKKTSYGEASGWTITLDNFGQWDFYGGGTSKLDGCASSAFNMNSWQHILVTVNGTNATMYCNGAYASSGAITAITTNDNNITFGEFPGGANDYDGYMDDIVWFDRPITLSEVQEIYASRGNYSDEDLKSYITFTGGSLEDQTGNGNHLYNNGADDFVVVGNSTKISDLTGLGGDALPTDGKSRVAYDVKYGKSTFSESGGSYDDDSLWYIPDSAVVDNAGKNISLCAWTYANSAGQNIILFKGLGGSTYPEYALGTGQLGQAPGLDSGHYSFEVRSGGGEAGVDSTNNAILDEWVHICGVRNQTGLHMYVNGVLNASDNYHTVNTPGNNGDILQIGGDNFGSPSRLEWDGMLDELMAFNISLTADDVARIYNETADRFKPTGEQYVQPFNMTLGSHNKINVTTNSQQNLGTNLTLQLGEWNNTRDGYLTSDTALDLYFPMDNYDGSDVTEVALGNDGARTGTTSPWDDGAFGEAFDFGGTSSDYLDVGSTSDYRYENYDNITISVWFNLNESLGTGDKLFLKRYASLRMDYGVGIDSNELIYTCDGDGNLYKCYAGGAGAGAIGIDVGDFELNRWYQAVWVLGYNGTGTTDQNGGYVKMYLDGEYVGTIIENHGTSTDGRTPIFHLGDGWDGRLDEVMLFNRSLTDDEIKQLYQDSQISGAGINWTVSDEQKLTDLNTFDVQNDSYLFQPIFNYETNSSNNFYTPYLIGNMTIESYEGEGGEPAVDETSPTYSLNQTNNTIAGESTLFSILWDDDTALNPNGQYIFSTNNTGTWVNESAVNFTATPQWANVTKTLNSTEGVSVGYKWYATDNAGNLNESEIFTLTTKEIYYEIVWNTYPASGNHTQNTTETYSVDVTCRNGDCGETNVTLDPIVGGVTDRWVNISDINGWDNSRPVPTQPRQIARCDDKLVISYINNSGGQNKLYLGVSEDNSTFSQILIQNNNVRGTTIDCYNDIVGVIYQNSTTDPADVAVSLINISDNSSSYYKLLDDMMAGGGLDIIFINSTRVYALSSNNSETFVITTDDYFSSFTTHQINNTEWSATHDVTSPVSLVANDNKVGVVGLNRTKINYFNSSNSGVTWSSMQTAYSPVDIEQGDSFYMTNYNNHIYVIGGDYSYPWVTRFGSTICIYESEDFMETWENEACINVTNDGDTLRGSLDGGVSYDKSNGDAYITMEFDKDTSEKQTKIIKYNGTLIELKNITTVSASNRCYMPHPSRYLTDDGYLEMVCSQTTDTAVAYLAFDISSGASEEPPAEGKGIIPVGSGTPFWVVEQNPNTTTMTEDQTITFSWTVNATGAVGGSYDFFAEVQRTSAPIAYNATNNITINITSGLIETELTCHYDCSTDPTIDNESINSCSNITLDGTGTALFESFESSWIIADKNCNLIAEK